MSCCGVCGGQESDSNKENDKDKDNELTKEQVQVPIQVVQLQDPAKKPEPDKE